MSKKKTIKKLKRENYRLELHNMMLSHEIGYMRYRQENEGNNETKKDSCKQGKCSFTAKDGGNITVNFIDGKHNIGTFVKKKKLAVDELAYTDGEEDYYAGPDEDFEDGWDGFGVPDDYDEDTEDYDGRYEEDECDGEGECDGTCNCNGECGENCKCHTEGEEDPLELLLFLRKLSEDHEKKARENEEEAERKANEELAKSLADTRNMVMRLAKSLIEAHEKESKKPNNKEGEKTPVFKCPRLYIFDLEECNGCPEFKECGSTGADKPEKSEEPERPEGLEPMPAIRPAGKKKVNRK